MKIAALSVLAVVLTASLGWAQDQRVPDVAPSSLLRVPDDAPPMREGTSGPYEVVIESHPGLPTHTIYRPSDWSQFGGSNQLPIVSWGNGACANTGRLFQVFLTKVASHGYYVISIGPKDAPLPSFATGSSNNAQTATTAPARSTDEQLIHAIDWVITEQANNGSPLHGKVDPERIAVMGQSCGGLQAIAVAADPRIDTVVLWNSGVFEPNASSIGARLSSATKAHLQKLHTPVAYFIGGPTDVAFPNAEDDFKRINHVPVFKANLNVGHGGTFRHPSAGWYGEVGVAWLDWQLKRSKNAAAYFEGSKCTLCTDPVWKVERKGIE